MLFESVADLESAERGEYQGINYARQGLPTVTDLQSAVATLEGGHAALAVPSGLAAITMALLAVLQTGDHVLVTDSVYGPARRFCDNQLKRFGINVTYYDPLIGAGIEREIRADTKLVYAESPGSLSFDVQDIPAIARTAHARDVLLLIDNTWATPIGFASFAHGADISLHAGTKYLGGHSDVLNGMIVCNETTYPAMRRLWTDMGAPASSDDCFLALRGLRTLAVRLERHTRSALTVAQWLQQRPEVAEVIYPALPGSRGHELWKRDFTGASGLFGVVLNPVAKPRIDAMLDGLRLFRMGWSWGGFESLIIPTNPQRTRTAAPWQAAGPCLRLHVGLEDSQDLITDLEAGFARLAS
jgi:cystathionine beta-lyase